MGYCDKQGERVYPDCDKQLLVVSLESEEDALKDTTKILVSNSAEGTSEGFVCDEGFRDGAAKIICRENGFKDGRAAAGTIHTTEKFKWTNLRCEEGSGVGGCSVDGYAETDRNPFSCKNEEAASVSCFNKPLEVNIRIVNKKKKYVTVDIAVKKDGRAINAQDLKKLISSNVDKFDYFKIKADDTLHNVISTWTRRRVIRLKMKNGKIPKNACSVILLLSGSLIESEQFC